KPMSARTQATIAIPIGARSVPGVVARARVTARIAMASLPLGQAGQYLQQVLRSEEHTSELQSRGHLVCRLLLEKKKKKNIKKENIKKQNKDNHYMNNNKQ